MAPPKHHGPPQPVTQSANENDNMRLDKLTRILRTMPYKPVASFRPTYIVRELILNIENQNTFSGYIYDEVSTLQKEGESPLMTRDEFIRVWKSCILQRALDLKVRQTGKPSPSYLYFERPTRIPAPLAHLLEALGRVHCPYTGVILDMVPPELDIKNLPEWAIYDAQLVEKWTKFLSPFSQSYVHVYSGGKQPRPPPNETFPDMDDYDGKTIGLTATKIVHGKVIVRSLSKYVKESDVMIRVCHDELFVSPVCAFEDMCTENSNKYETDTLRKSYFSYNFLTHGAGTLQLQQQY